MEEAGELVRGLVADGRVVTLAGRSLEEEAAAGSILISADGFRALGARAVAETERFHATRPLRRGVPREELRSRLQLDERLFAAALERWAADGLLVESGATVAVAGWSPALPAEQQRQADAYVQSLAAKPYAPPTDGAPEPDLLAYLEEAGQVVAVGDGIVFGADAYREMVERITGRLKSEGTITLAQVRDMFGTSRKYAQALLEHLDRERVTRRVGDERVLRERPG